MQLAELVAELDAYFRVPDVRGDDWSDAFEQVYPDPYWRDYVEPGWEGRWNGLSVRGGDDVRRAVTCVFPSDRIVAGLAPGTFLFSEHPLDFADEPGFLPLSPASFERMREDGISFYNVHAPLDMHPEVSPSRLCARGVGLESLVEYFPICEGIPGGAAVIGESGLTVDGLADALRSYLGPEILVHVLTRSRSEAGRVAMVAGGGAVGGHPGGVARARLRHLRDRQRGDELPARLRAGAGRGLPRACRRGRRHTGRRNALRHGEAAAAGDARLVQGSWPRGRVRSRRTEVGRALDGDRQLLRALAGQYQLERGDAAVVERLARLLA